MLSGYSKELQILPHATAQMLSASEMWRFLVFSKFLKEFIYKEIQKIWNYQLDEDTTLLLAYTLAPQLLPLNMNAQVPLVSEIRSFCQFFVRETWNLI